MTLRKTFAETLTSKPSYVELLDSAFRAIDAFHLPSSTDGGHDSCLPNQIGPRLNLLSKSPFMGENEVALLRYHRLGLANAALFDAMGIDATQQLQEHAKGIYNASCELDDQDPSALIDAVRQTLAQRVNAARQQRGLRQNTGSARSA